jgi:hypothetical protein
VFTGIRVIESKCDREFIVKVGVRTIVRGQYGKFAMSCKLRGPATLWESKTIPGVSLSMYTGIQHWETGKTTSTMLKEQGE